MGEKFSHAEPPGANEPYEQEIDQSTEDYYWLHKAREGFRYTTDYMDDSVRSDWEDALLRFQNEHPYSSKYNSDAYSKRSRIFRPKIRSAERRTSALAYSALFQNQDLIEVRGQNRNSPEQAASAALNKELLQYRLEHSVPWVTTALGARQDAFNYGVCISFQNWLYEEVGDGNITPSMDEFGDPEVDEDGNELGSEGVKILEDRPDIQLIRPENFRFDPNSDWRNPIQDSPVLIWMMPMFAGDVMDRMGRENPVTGEADWKDYELSTVLQSATEEDESESVRQARMGRGREDPTDDSPYGENTVVWVHLNIVRDEGRDYCYYTLGTRLMLSKEVLPVEEVLPLGRESFTIGFAIIETHKTYPEGENTIAAPLSDELNDIANQRMDNVKLALNKRYVIKRNAQVDLKALARNVPGGGVFAGDVDDVRVIETPDVTGSSYQEQDRLAQELDELLGNFSSSSVQANRSMNETVGGMNLLSQDANSVQELALSIWIKTWVVPVLRKFQKLEAMFETDETVLKVAAENAELMPRYGISEINDWLLDQEMIVSVNVGIGSSSPQQKMERIVGAVQAVAGLPDFAARLNVQELGKEIFSSAGYSEGGRFIIPEEEFQKKQAELAQMQQQPMHQIEVAQIQAQSRLQEKQLEVQARQYDTDKEYEAAMARLSIESNMRLKELYEKIGVEEARLQTQRDSTALKELNKSRELAAKELTGSGI